MTFGVMIDKTEIRNKESAAGKDTVIEPLFILYPTM